MLWLLEHIRGPCSFAAILLVFLIFTNNCIAQGSARRFPLGSPLDQILPILGTRVSSWPPWIQRRGVWDPQAQIVCYGDTPLTTVPTKFHPPSFVEPTNPWEAPSFRALYGRNPRALCAKVAYGGTLAAWTAGAYCAPQTSPPTMMFEKLPPGAGEMDDDVKRVFLMCQQQCRCVEGTFQDLAQQGRPATVIRESEELNPDEVLQDPDRFPISNARPPRAKLYSTYPPLESGRGTRVPVYFIPEVDARRLGSNSRIIESNTATTLWLPAFPGQWAPKCASGWRKNYFGQVDLGAQEICAAEWFGGSSHGNAGIVCKYNPREPGVTTWSDPSMSHPAFQGIFAVGIARNRYVQLKMDCGVACKCEEPEKESPQQAVLSEGIFDAARDFITGTCRVGQIGQAFSNVCKSITGFGSRGTRHRQVNADLRLDYMCRTQKVNGFDLAGSIAAQSLCNDRYRGLDVISRPSNLGALGG